MTEFKKLGTLIGELREDVENLYSAFRLSGAASSSDAAASPSTELDVPALYTRALRLLTEVPSAYARVRKITLKARETDPNRQLYNEMMCGKIEDLYTTFCVLLVRLLTGSEDQGLLGEVKEKFSDEAWMPAAGDAPAIEWVEGLHAEYMLRRARAEAWQERVASGLTQLVVFEEEARAVVMAEERSTRGALVESKRRDKKATAELLQARAEARWAAELSRRREEHQRLRSAAAALDVKEVAALIRTDIAAVYQPIFAASAGGLARALLTTPEDVNIRVLRNDNQRMLREYGHPCATQRHDARPCGCAAVVQTAEIIWYKLGYRVQYTNAPTSSLQRLLASDAADTITLPCGAPLSAHDYSPLGFEDYAERMFELAEPNAMNFPDRWMEWYNTVQAVQTELTSISSTRS